MKKALTTLLSMVLLFSLSIVASAPTSAASSEGVKRGYHQVKTKLLPGDKMKVSWKKTPNVKFYAVIVSLDGKQRKNVKTYKTKKTSIVVPLAKGSSAKSGNYTFVKVRVQYKKGKYANAPVRAVKPSYAKAPTSAARAKVLSWNIGTSRKDSSARWNTRKTAIAKKVNASNGDIIAFQEIGAKVPNSKKQQWVDMKSLFASKYKFVYPEPHSYYTSSGAHISQDSKLLYDSTKWSVQSKGTFLLKGGSKGSNRWSEWALFKNKSTGKSIHVMSVHLQNGDNATAAKQRRTQSKEVASYVKKIAKRTGHQFVVAGDMNSNIFRKNGGNIVQRVFNSAGFYDAFSTKKRSGALHATFNGYGKTIKSYGRIDYIFTYGKMQGSYSYKNVFSNKSTPVADHNLQIAVLPY